jgi:hypothetical protein
MSQVLVNKGSSSQATHENRLTQGRSDETGWLRVPPACRAAKRDGCGTITVSSKNFTRILKIHIHSFPGRPGFFVFQGEGDFVPVVRKAVGKRVTSGGRYLRRIPLQVNPTSFGIQLGDPLIGKR